MKPTFLLFVILFLFSNCKGPDKPSALPVIQEEPMKTKEELLRELKSNQWNERSQAIVEIAKSKDKTYIPELRSLLKKDSNPAVRGSAALALGDFEDKASTQDITKLFLDKEISTDIVLDALTRMKDPSAANSIIPYFDSENHTCRIACYYWSW